MVYDVLKQTWLTDKFAVVNQCKKDTHLNLIFKLQ